MKEFFTQCMKDLYALTGIEQVRWMQQDMTNGKRDFDLCVEAMCQVSKQFPYIKEPDQQAIIRRMMIEDRKYDKLNSRTVWGWLDLHKDAHYRSQTHFQESTTEVPTYAEYLEVCNLNGIEPLPETEYDKPVDSERIGYMNQKINEAAESLAAPRSSLAKELKSKMETIECKHLTETGLDAYHEFDPGVLTCMTCGHKKAAKDVN